MTLSALAIFVLIALCNEGNSDHCFNSPCKILSKPSYHQADVTVLYNKDEVLCSAIIVVIKHMPFTGIMQVFDCPS